jgi:enoyl-[acyl-carrier protein] reductase I
VIYGYTSDPTRQVRERKPLTGSDPAKPPGSDPAKPLERRVRKLVDPLGVKLVTPCDVQKDEDLARTFDQAKETYGGLDFVLHSIAFAPLEDLKCSFVDCSREGFKTAMDISVYSLVAVSRYGA